MHHKGNCCCPTPTIEPAVLQHALLALLVDSAPQLWTLDELARVLRSREEAMAGADTTHQAESAVAELYGAGLVHRHGRFLFATHAAISAAELAEHD
jgi:hypothetical protein